MTTEETLKRVREIMDENKISYDERTELEMGIIYQQAVCDALKSQLKEMEG